MKSTDQIIDLAITVSVMNNAWIKRLGTSKNTDLLRACTNFKGLGKSKRGTISIIRGLRLLFVLPMLLISTTAFSFSQFSPSEDTHKPVVTGKNKKTVPIKPSIKVSKEGVSIVVNNGVLGEVLQDVANETDIRFRVSNKLARERITADVRAEDWDSGVQKLLKGNSTISLWDTDSKLTEVVVMESNNRKQPNQLKSDTSNQLKTLNNKTSKND